MLILSSTNRQFNNSPVQQLNSSTIHQFDSSPVRQFTSSTIQQSNKSTIQQSRFLVLPSWYYCHLTRYSFPFSRIYQAVFTEILAGGTCNLVLIPPVPQAPLGAPPRRTGIHGSTTSWFFNLDVRCWFSILQFNLSTIQQFNSSTIQQFDNSTVRQFNSSTIHQFDNPTIQQFTSSTIPQSNKSTVRQFHNSTIQQSRFLSLTSWY